jgi:methylmalonyl-CoA mutase cobalamin-binding subunit
MVDHQLAEDSAPTLHRPEARSHSARAGNTGSDTSIVARIIELEIIPGLLSRSRVKAETRHGPPGRIAALQVSPGMVDKLADLAIHAGPAGCQAYIDRLCARGLEQRSLFGNLFANVARLLGRMWEDDTCTFIEVTIGISVLQQLIRDNADDTLIGPAGRDMPVRVLLLPAPREQHIFGILILAQSLRTSGFDVDLEFAVEDPDHVTRIVSARPCDCIGFSCSNDRWLDGLSESVSKLRHYAGFGPRPIVLGGPAISRCPERVRQMTVNGTAEDDTGIVCLLQRLTSARPMAATNREFAGTG